MQYIKGKEILEEFLFCEPLELTGKGSDVFNYIKDFFKKIQILMDEIGSMCTNGATVMLDKNSGFFCIYEERGYNNMLHRHVLESKTLPESLKQQLGTTVSVANYIQGWVLNHCMFHAF